MTGNGKPRLSVFKGREAKLNRTILLILAQESSLNIWRVYKRVREVRGLRHTRYRVVNRRMKDLEHEGYIEVCGQKETPQGLKANLYQLTVKTYLAFLLGTVSLDTLIQQANDADAITLLAALSSVIRF